MIKVLHVLRAMDRGGAETMIMNFYRKVDKKEFQFDFLVCVDKECDYDKEIQSLGGSIFRLPAFVGLNHFSFKRECYHFFANHHDYNIIHVHIGSCANIVMKEAKKYNIQTIAHSHNTNFGMSLEAVLLKVLAFNTKNVADYFFACSKQAGIDRFSNKIVKGERFFIINNGIDLEKFHFSKERYNTLREAYKVKGKIVYGHVGRFIDVKNHDFLIDVFNGIQKIQSNAVLLLAGRGPLEEDIKSKVASLGLQDKIVFLGVISEVEKLLLSLDCFIFPSKFEGLGIAVIEAQATGVPCVISDAIPKEGRISSELSVLSLRDDIGNWINASVRSTSIKIDRENAYKEVKDAEFDINDSVVYLCDRYRDMIKK